jgi:hypothetical protein
MSLIAARPASAPTDVVLPDVTVLTGDARPVQRTVAVTGSGLRLREAVGLRPVRGGVGWQVASDDWRLLLAVVPIRPAGSAPARVELAEVEAARGDDGRWVRRATVWLTQTAAGDLRASWPAPVHVVAVELDDRSLPPPDDTAGGVTVPLSTGAGVRRLRFTWAGEVDEPPPVTAEVPALAMDGEPVPAGPVLWTVVAPSGERPAADTTRLHPAAADLYRAAAQLRLAEAARSTYGDVARARAAAELRRADAALADGGNLSAGPNGVTLAVWRQQLGDAVRPGAAAAASEREERAYDDAFTRGSPSAWYVAPGDDGPRLTWPPAAPSWPDRLLRSIAVLIAGLVGLWLGKRLGAGAWPEQLGLLGAAAWIADGHAAWLALTAVGVAARGSLAAVAAWRRWLAGAESDQAASADREARDGPAV